MAKYKYIFDFDDTLFKNTELLKPRIFSMISKATGTSEKDIETRYYTPAIRDHFSLIEFIQEFFTQKGIPQDGVDSLFKEIMSESHKFLNVELLEEIKKIPPEDCYIVTTGRQDWNWSKLAYSGILEYFIPQNIVVVPGKKSRSIRNICHENKDFTVIFIDDKSRFIEELKQEKVPNLQCLLYKGENLTELVKKIEGYRSSELRGLK
ncbi:MAG: hypothetical protein WCT44_01640 [Candidatus Paceibacterota bacterium]